MATFSPRARDRGTAAGFIRLARACRAAGAVIQVAAIY